MENLKDSSTSPEPGSKRKESPEYVNVAVAIIEQDGKFLVGKWASDKQYAGKWAFLGGKLEPGEKPEEALRREIREELGMEVKIVRTLPVTDANLSDGKSFRLHIFVCKIGQGPLKMDKEHVEHRWVTPAELQALDFIDPDKAIFSFLQGDESR